MTGTSPRVRAPLVAVAAAGLAALGADAVSAQEPSRPAAARGDSVRGEAEGAPQERGGHAFLGGYALLAYDPSSGQIGAVAASSGFSAGSGILALEPGRGAVAVLGRHAHRARRAASEALSEGSGAAEVASRALSAAGRPPGLQVTALTTDCRRSSRTAEGAYPWTGALRGEDGAVCFSAAGAFLADSSVAARLAGAFREGEGALIDRLQAALTAAEAAAGEVARSRSAAMWISAPDPESGALGRADLRLQVEDVQRPAAALRAVIRAGRAEQLARRASRAVDAGRHGRGVELADRALDQDPATALAWMARGRARLFQGKDAEAETAFRRMLEVNPHLLHLLGDPSAAVRDTAGGGAPPAPEVRRELIPYRPRLILRLDEYRRAFHQDVDFPERKTRDERDRAGGEGGQDG